MTIDTTPTQEDTMGALNTTRLKEVVSSEQNLQTSRQMQIHTRAEQRLEADTNRASDLDGEIADLGDYVTRTRDNIAEMQRLLAQAETNLKNAKIEHAACLESIHSLRAAGVSLPVQS